MAKPTKTLHCERVLLGQPQRNVPFHNAKLHLESGDAPSITIEFKVKSCQSVPGIAPRHACTHTMRRVFHTADITCVKFHSGAANVGILPSLMMQTSSHWCMSLDDGSICAEHGQFYRPGNDWIVIELAADFDRQLLVVHDNVICVLGPRSLSRNKA